MDLKAGLRERTGLDLLVLRGKPEELLPRVRAAGGSRVSTDSALSSARTQKSGAAPAEHTEVATMTRHHLHGIGVHTLQVPLGHINTFGNASIC